MPSSSVSRNMSFDTFMAIVGKVELLETQLEVETVDGVRDVSDLLQGDVALRHTVEDLLDVEEAPG